MTIKVFSEDEVKMLLRILAVYLPIYQTTRRHIPEYIAVRVHPRTSLTSHMTIKVFSEDEVKMLLRILAVYLPIYQTARQHVATNLCLHLNDPSPSLLC
jgi:hypothetical protein